MNRGLKYAVVWLIGLALIFMSSNILGYLLAVITGQGLFFGLTLPALLTIFHGILIWGWGRRSS